MLLLGIRNQIFQHVFKNSDGYYALAEDYLTANTMIKCDADWTQARRLLSKYICRCTYFNSKWSAGGVWQLQPVCLRKDEILNNWIWNTSSARFRSQVCNTKRWRAICSRIHKKMLVEKIMWQRNSIWIFVFPSKQVSNLGLEATLPGLFSRDTGSSNSVSKSRDFFTKERGSIAVSEAVCLTHRADIRNIGRCKQQRLH